MEDTPLSRRVFIVTGITAAAGVALRYATHSSSVAAQEALPAPHLVTLVDFTPDGKRGAAVQLLTIVKPEADWEKQLSPSSFEVTRHESTEFPFSGKYEQLHDHGIFRCICCDTALFSSDTKFDSGTGWPSFYEPIAKENVLEVTDRTYGMARTAVACRRCNAHLGHVFNDGPQPTYLRYCMNSVSLNFVKTA